MDLLVKSGNPMKMRRLSEIDLAKLAPIPAGPQLEQALRAYNASGGAWSYDPIRASTADILGASTPLYGPLPEISWEKIEYQIKMACSRGAIQESANTLVGKVLFDEARNKGWRAAKFSMSGLAIGIREAVRYWSSVVLEDEDGLFIPFFDHRREHGVASREAQQIVFSMQHIGVRDRYPDLTDTRLAIVQFPSSGEMRTVRVEFHNEAELLSYEELDSRVRTVYETWARVSTERTREPRKKTGTGDLFGF